ncbi:MAG TPA: hypothetical protein VGH28_11910 [Polyangiaceae bacterium]|jgi:hypothetical protein
MKLRVLVALVSSAAIATLAGACDDQGAPPACRNIPDGGCPSQGGVACQDPSCAAIYACGDDGGWTFVATCPASDGSVQDANVDAPSPSDAGYDIDAPPGAFGGPGCNALEPPDCPLGTALACPQGQCCGCQDLFVCDDGGWDPWGTCSDDGGIKTL